MALKEFREGGGGCVGFDVTADSRQFAAKNFHDLDGCRNISSSIDYEGLTCLACANPHSLAESMGRGEPVVVCISDQNFPPILPAEDSKCVVVIRVEEGRLFEIENAFVDIFTCHCSPHGRLPQGSVVLVGSLSHLGLYGLESYAIDLVKSMASLAARVGAGVGVVPYVPVPLGGIENGEVIRALFDLDSWLLNTCSAAGALLEGARSAFWGVIARAGVGGGSASTGRRTYHLPSSAVNPRRRPFTSPAVVPPLPGRVPPLGEEDKKTIVRELLVGVAGQYGVGINCNPSLERGMVTPVSDNVTGRIIVVGASHMCRMTESVSMNFISLAYPGFRPTKDGVENVVEKLENITVTENDTVVMDLISNVAFMGTDKDGLPTPSIRGGDGKYHVPGVLTTAPPTTLKKNLEACNAIADRIKIANVILICPTPRYVHEKCCNDPAHIENHSNTDFDEEIAEYQEQHRRVLGGWATARGLDFCVMDPTAIVNPTEPLLRHHVTSGGASIWCSGDPVHLSLDAYRDLAMAVQEAHEGTAMAGGSASDCSDNVRRRTSSGSGSCNTVLGMGKKRVPDAVVTLTAPGYPKRGRFSRPPATAGWLRGVATKGRGNSAQNLDGGRGRSLNRGRRGRPRGQRGHYGFGVNKGRGYFGRKW